MRQQEVGPHAGEAATRGPEVPSPKGPPNAALDEGADPKLVVQRRDDEFVICQANRLAGRFLDTEPERIIGKTLSEVVGQHVVGALCHFAQGRGLAGPWRIQFHLGSRPASMVVEAARMRRRRAPLVLTLVLQEDFAGPPIRGSVSDLLGGDSEVSAYVDEAGVIQYATGWHVLLARQPSEMEGMHIDDFFAPVGTPAPGVLVSWPIPGRDEGELTCRALITEVAATRLIHLRVGRS